MHALRAASAAVATGKEGQGALSTEEAEKMAFLARQLRVAENHISQITAELSDARDSHAAMMATLQAADENIAQLSASLQAAQAREAAYVEFARFIPVRCYAHVRMRGRF
ncbi:hypothetical protein EON66_08860 [archaeon]|nr:MAG: hypothetical protein EON66_08860 [archaeon]